MVEHLVFGNQLVQFQRRRAGVEHDIALEIQHLLDVFQRHIQHRRDPARQRLQEPDMRHRRGQLDMPHPLSAHLG